MAGHTAVTFLRVVEQSICLMRGKMYRMYCMYVGMCDSIIYMCLFIYIYIHACIYAYIYIYMYEAWLCANARFNRWLVFCDDDKCITSGVCILYLLYDTFMHVCMCLLIFQHVFPVYEHKYFYSTHLCLL